MIQQARKSAYTKGWQALLYGQRPKYRPVKSSLSVTSLMSIGRLLYIQVLSDSPSITIPSPVILRPTEKKPIAQSQLSLKMP